MFKISYVRCVVSQHVVAQTVLYSLSQCKTLLLQSQASATSARAKTYLQNPLSVFTVPNRLLFHKQDHLILYTHLDLGPSRRHQNLHLKKRDFWDVAPCVATLTLFRGTCCLHLQSSCVLIIEAADRCEIVERIYQTARSHIPDDSITFMATEMQIFNVNSYVFFALWLVQLEPKPRPGFP
jgi:hypothetical protein